MFALMTSPNSANLQSLDKIAKTTLSYVSHSIHFHIYSYGSNYNITIKNILNFSIFSVVTPKQ